MTPPVAVRRSNMAIGAIGGLAAIVLLLVLWLIGLGFIWALLIGLVVGGALAAFIYLRSESMILTAIGATPVRAGEHQRVQNLVEGLCVANGFREPDLFVIEDSAPNMMMLGRHPTRGAMAFTTGLFDTLTRVELEGVIAHELLRMRHRATTVEGTTAVVSRFLGPLGAVFADKMIDPATSVELDIEGVRLTRYPPGLTNALQTLRSDGREPAKNPAWARHMWIHPPAGALVADEFDLDARIQLLEEL